jgi:hypothetical protein
MAQEPSSRDLLDAVKQQESGGRRYDKSGKLLEGPPTKYGTAKGEMQVLDMTNKDPGFGVQALPGMTVLMSGRGWVGII